VVHLIAEEGTPLAGEENTADKNNESSNPQSVAPLGITQPVTSEGGELNENSEATQAPPQAHQGESEKPPKKPGRIAAFLFGDNPDRTNRTIALATVIIAGSAIIQLGVAVAQYSEMYSGGKQTDDIIHAAKKIKLALITANKQNSDAVSETLTQNQGQFAATLGQMKNQVGKLQAGVDETARLAQAAVNANEISHEALEAQVRPWIGLTCPPFLVQS